MSHARTRPRAEWLVWQQLRGHAAGSTVRFGDYGITHPVYNSVPISGSANIRYTHTNDWLIARGRKVTGAAYGGFGQFVALSKTVVGDTRYCGTQYSWGDDYVSQCSAGTVSTGNMTTWRAVGTNHHITFVVRQLATSAAASAAPAPPPVVGPTAATPPADGP